jgi:hypothetical protein
MSLTELQKNLTTSGHIGARNAFVTRYIHSKLFLLYDGGSGLTWLFSFFPVFSLVLLFCPVT